MALTCIEPNLIKLAVSVEEAAAMSGHSRSAIYTTIAEGGLSSFKSGKRRLILVRDIEKWLIGLSLKGQR